MKLPAAVLFPLIVLPSCCIVAAANFSQCLLDVRSGKWGLDGAVDSNGNSVSDLAYATGLTYRLCVEACGSANEAFDWHTFSQQFSSWLLPWLALISQLPYGAGDTLNNFLSVLLTIGSPTLAAYSLVLAVITNRWMIKRFRRSDHRNTFLAAQILSNLQHAPLHLSDDECVVPSLIVLEENDAWWMKLANGLDYSVPKWTFASVMSVIYVAIADIFTWVDTLGGPLYNVKVNASGQSMSSLWLCFLPIVICNLQISPKTDLGRIRRAFEYANKSFYLATETGEPEQGCRSLMFDIRTASRDIVDEDELCTVPIFFYARFFSWFRVARKVTDSFDAASQRAANGIRSPRRRGRVVEYCRALDEIRSYEGESQVIEYCGAHDDKSGDHSELLVAQHPRIHGDKCGRTSYDVISIFIRAAALAIFLQWGTTGAAVMAMYYTPTKGVGCRAGSHMLYGFLSTLVWALSVVSSVLAHAYTTSRQHNTTSSVIRSFSVALRHIAKSIAALNAIWLFLSAVFQFSNLSNSCWCNSTVLTLGKNRGYTVIDYPETFAKDIKNAWVGGLVMSFLTAALFVLVINLLKKHPEPQLTLSE
ncbi:hypothetical protein AX15_007507 [Amanita polypyramis BW_CC]|nr:hypothetical protein AX15_007507 [Amanita polypyramis BW_CC]